ncbi:S-layer protein domain-containing protein [Methanolobus sp. WCC5]|uniref:S-layer protein domain-containing protein n=1 Tax=Methanolobus sp. WCC5 TaxID=3125785 RepID=UPI003254EE2D
MKRFTTIAMIALLALAALVVPATAAVQSVEVRSSVYDLTDYPGAPVITITPTEFAGFWYNLDSDLSSEEIELTFASNTTRTIAEDALVYNTTIQQTDYEADFDDEPGASNTDNTTYPVIGLFAEKYVPLDDDEADELVKLLLDTDDKYTLRTGSALQLANGYELTAKQIDVEGNKVWMELSKDGDFIEDEVLDVSNGAVTWTYDSDVGDKEDVIVFRAHITQVFQGQVDSLAIIEGIWLIDYENILTIEDEDKFGKLEVSSVSGGSIELVNSNSITLSKDKVVDIAEGLAFKVADDNDVRFYLMKEYTAPGTYEVRGSVATGADTWTSTEFAGFFYDLTDDIGTEELEVVTAVSGASRTIDSGELLYNTTIAQADYAADFDDEPGASNTDNTTYPIIGFFAEKYVSLDDDEADELVKLLLDSDDKYTLRTGSALQLANGYELTAKQIDVEGNKVWMEFSKDGDFIEDEVLDVSNGAVTWTYDTDVGDKEDVIVFRAHITQVFQGQVDSLAIIEGLWLIDYENILTIEDDDKFGKLEVTGISGSTINMESSSAITLSKGKDISIAENMYFKVADDNTLRYYPYVELTIAGDGVTQPDDEEPVEEPETPVEEPETPVEEPETPVEEPETPVEEPETPEEEPAEPSPGFEIVFAVAGLLAVAYLVRRN